LVLAHLVALAVGEWYMPQLSLLLFSVSFLVVYTLFLSALLVVDRLRLWRMDLRAKAPLLWARLARWENYWEADPETLAPENLLPPTPEEEGEESVAAEPPPLIALLIPAHNEAVILAGTLRNLAQLSYPHWELWVLNDRSTDDTQAVLAQLQHTFAAEGLKPFHVFNRPQEARPGKSAVLNDALALTQAPLLAVLDADAQVPPTFLEDLLPYLQPEYVAAVQARKVVLNAKANWLTTCQQRELFLDAHIQRCRDLAGAAVELRGNGFLVKRAAVEAVGLWNEASLTDDLDLSTRLHLAGYLIRFAWRVPVWEEGVLQFGDLLRQRRRWAEGSLRRYLDYGWAVLTQRDVTLRTRADMVAYWVNFVFPLLLACDYGVWGVSSLLGHASAQHLGLTLAMAPAFAVGFVPAIYVALRRFERPARWRSLCQAVGTGLFMVVVWTPVVFYTFANVLLKPNAPFHWHKTARSTPTT
jgi:1,2-diacylglycerol 3-beta-glucosyltransferase